MRVSHLLRFGVALFVATLMLAGPLGSAHVSAASCGGSASSCDHTSPQTTGCAADAVTKATVYIADELYPQYNIGKVELRYSPSCHTAWSRVWITASDGGQFSTNEWVQRKSDGATDHRYDALWYGESAYSHQLYVRGTSGRACASISNGTVAEGQACTAYVALS